MSENNLRYTLYRNVDDKVRKVTLTREYIENRLKAGSKRSFVSCLLGWLGTAVYALAVFFAMRGDDDLNGFRIAIVAVLVIACLFNIIWLIKILIEIITKKHKRFSLDEDVLDKVSNPPLAANVRRLLLHRRNTDYPLIFNFTSHGKYYIIRSRRRLYRDFEPYDNITAEELLQTTSNGEKFYTVNYGKRVFMMFKQTMFELDDDLAAQLKNQH